jgi:hypothetical protein
MDLMEASAYLVCSPGKLRDLVILGKVSDERPNNAAFGVTEARSTGAIGHGR